MMEIRRSTDKRFGIDAEQTDIADKKHRVLRDGEAVRVRLTMMDSRRLFGGALLDIFKASNQTENSMTHDEQTQGLLGVRDALHSRAIAALQEEHQRQLDAKDGQLAALQARLSGPLPNGAQIDGAGGSATRDAEREAIRRQFPQIDKWQQDGRQARDQRDADLANAWRRPAAA